MAKKNFYAVARGRDCGVIVETWFECEALVKGYKGALFKGFLLKAHAKMFLDDNAIPIVEATLEIETLVIPEGCYVCIPARIDSKGRSQPRYYMQDGIRMADHGRTIGRGYQDYYKAKLEESSN